jgi:hypothetical protein
MKLPTSAIVTTRKLEGSDWAHFESQTPATAYRRSPISKAASPQVRGHVPPRDTVDRKRSRSRSAPLTCSR